MKRVGIILALCALAVAAGCKKFSVECELIVQPRAMISSGSDPLTPAYMARAYVFYIDDREYLDPVWRPNSYADAEAGIVRHVSTDGMRTYNLTGVQGEDTFIHIVLTKSPMMLVAVDPINRMYAWRTFKYEIPLEKILVPVSFKAYQQTPYKENEWTVVNEAHENAPQQEDSVR